ncbi:hypothetical protein [Bacteroides thetaiotaomicron]|uniref:hypothetical protein n=1 Tax=Bacteroides thetaiotaomicron TaxID=818 RepID=UPI001CE2AC82|nr:hypothetical protein [Bacteroides thetaiotaomicron]MCA6009137.1 hypothetical protein [Bacteroides thetaiotaomicron]UVS55745.1 hypothetical protein NXY23_14815 [Bacteroides thetaiotaomicron]
MLKMHTLISLRSFAISSFKKFYNHFAKNHHVEVCLLSQRITLKPLSIPLQEGIRFIHNLIPTCRSAHLTESLPSAREGDNWAYQVPYK